MLWTQGALVENLRIIEKEIKMPENDERDRMLMELFEERMRQKAEKSEAGPKPPPGPEEYGPELHSVENLEIAIGINEEDYSIIVMFNQDVQALRMTYQQALSLARALADQAVAADQQKAAKVEKITRDVKRGRPRRKGNGRP